MNIRELYDKIGGNYDQAVRVMKSDRLIEKYVRKLLNNDVNAQLAQAGQSMDPVKLFESAHAMKGVCANLGLEALAQAADEITEEFRPGKSRRLSDDAVREKLAAIDARFKATAEGIKAFEGK